MRCFAATVLFLSLVLSAIPAVGQSWIQIPPQTNRDYYSCWFDPSNPDHGATAGWYLQSWDLIPFVCTTTNGGYTMNYQIIYMGGLFSAAQSITFTSPTIGYVAGTGILKTYNGGTNWDWCLDSGVASSRFYELAFATPDSGYVVGESWGPTSGVVFRTTDAGMTWVRHDITYQSTTIACIARPSARAMYAGAAYAWGPTLFKSTDDGTTWTALNFNLGTNSLSFSSAKAGVAATEAGIWRTTDGGIIWTSVLGAPAL